MAEYNKDLDVVSFRESTKTEKRYLNVEVYSYDGGQKKVRIRPASKNTNPDCDPNRKWINGKAISALTKEEVSQLIKVLEKTLTQI